MSSASTRRRVLLAFTVIAATASTVVGATASNAEDNNAASARSGRWVGTWAAAPTGAGAGSSKNGFTDETVRMIVHTSTGGEGVRIRLSTAFGDRPLTIGHATVGLPTGVGTADVVPGSVRELTFGGRKSVTVPKGGQVLSDPARMSVVPLSDLVVTVHFPVATGPSTWHFSARQSAFVATGDHAADPAAAAFTSPKSAWYFLTGVDVLNWRSPGSVAVLGDSITDGLTATFNANKRWTDALAARVNGPRRAHSEERGRDTGVLNEGLAGNRLTHDGIEFGFNELGVNASARLNRDVFGQTGVRTVIVELGINDVWMTGESVDNITDQLRQLAAQAHEKGLRILVCTLSPWEGYTAFTPEKDALRLGVNAFIRGSRDIDKVLDFDALLRDPAAPTKLQARWDSGDHIHPNDAGYQAMADAVPLRDLN